ncbi:prolipoprotein diacylglyceryl transferase [Nodularia sp. NIES-3585]|uniref:prolipoprotein diacylglyceryl transferase n=1 Tax=Nodularia sp. NIES-3585 TaxID=1973477 RepID=UPI000B5CB3CF|nr:prolipoprotein diacylglyceryl transferase [Nodularia sp. NIES-3585]GAX34209.1 prolipoprotein diacylglyceryl transferase [Nodularia sp. NIES-3585]
MVLDISTLPLAFQFTSPGPIIVEIGPISIRWYGLLIATAVLIGVSLSQYLAKRRHVNPELISDLSIWLVIGAIPAARLYYVVFQWSEYSQRPERIIAIWQGGIAIHGAIIGGTLAALIFAKVNQISFWQLTDLVAPALILGQAIGRWGNFFNSEAFGRPTDLPWKLYIPPQNRPPDLANFEYFHPTFLYESLWNLIVFALLITLFFRSLSGQPRWRLGTIFLTYLVAYSFGRLWIEGFRIDSLMLGSLRIAQVVSLMGILVGLAGLAWLYLLKRPLPDVVSPPRGDEGMRE